MLSSGREVGLVPAILTTLGRTCGSSYVEHSKHNKVINTRQAFVGSRRTQHRPEQISAPLHRNDVRNYYHKTSKMHKFKNVIFNKHRSSTKCYEQCHGEKQILNAQTKHQHFCKQLTTSKLYTPERVKVT